MSTVCVHGAKENISPVFLHLQRICSAHSSAMWTFFKEIGIATSPNRYLFLKFTSIYCHTHRISIRAVQITKSSHN